MWKEKYFGMEKLRTSARERRVEEKRELGKERRQSRILDKHEFRVIFIDDNFH